MNRTALLGMLVACAAGCGEKSESGESAHSGRDAGGGSAGSAGASGSAGNGGQAGSAAGGAAATGGSADCGSTLPPPTFVEPGAGREVQVTGDPGAALGIFDPAPSHPAGAAEGLLGYSAVTKQNEVSTRIARSTDRGATFNYLTSVNRVEPLSVAVSPGSKRCPSGTCTGVLIHEVPSLVVDSSDPDRARVFKIFTHSYLVLDGGELARDLGYIALFTATAPSGPWTFEGKAIGWRSESELSSTNAKLDATSFAQLADCAALTEPAALALPGGVLELALGCAYLENQNVAIRIELLRSLDHAKTFGYAGRLLTAQDARCLGGRAPAFNAPHLFFALGTTYLSASTAGPTSGGFEGYRGCHVFELSAAGAAVKRDALGNAVPLLTLDAAGNRFVGACAYAEGASAVGYFVPELVLESPPRVFRIIASGIQAP